VYGSRKKRLNPKKAEIAAMRTRANLDAPERDQLLAQAATDRTLDRTCELMLLSMERFAEAPVLKEGVRAFVRAVLRAHPAFQPVSLVDALENPPDGSSDADLVRKLASQAYDAFSWADALPPLRKKEVEQCRANSLYCLLLWLRDTRRIPLERIVHHLQTSLWALSASGRKREPEKLRALVAARDAAALGLACSVLEAEVRDRSQQAEAARRGEERALARTAEIEGTLASVEAELGTARTELQRVAEELSGERAARTDERAHSRDQIEQLRGRVLGRLRAELSLLDEGLHALRRDPPRVHVMLDHAERAIEALRREMERLQGTN
jgi:hypothetical protein